MQQDLLRITEVMKILQMSRMQIHRLLKKGQFPNAMKIDPTNSRSVVVIPREDVEEFQKRQMVYKSS